MPLSNVILLSQIAGYSIAIVLSLCVIVPISSHIHDFNGHCLLFSSGAWNETNGQFEAAWASKAYCNYPLTVGVIILLASVTQLYRAAALLYRRQDSSFLGSFSDSITAMFLCILIIIASFFVTLGFVTWCRHMTQRFRSCEIAAGRQIDKEDHIDTTHSYVQIGTTQFGIWSSFACWVGLCVLSILKLIHHHEMENLKVSMYNERQRLVNEAADTSSLNQEGPSSVQQINPESFESPLDDDCALMD